MEEETLLGHIISKDGIQIDPTRIEAILQIPHPRNNRELQAFLGQISFLRRFISNLAKPIILLNNMLKKYSTIKWTLEAKNSFEDIKLALTQTPVLISPMFDWDFIIFLLPQNIQLLQSYCRKMISVLNNQQLSSVKP